MSLATYTGKLNLAGVLLFAERPEWIKPQFVVKAIRYPGNEIHVSDYLDTEDFSGPLSKIFGNSLSFVMRNLHKVQGGRGVNAPGMPEIPEAVFEELLVNALIHRDYFVSAPIRVFIFDNRIEIISPGHLPNNLTVERIRAGISNIRNPILVSFVAKGLLPYHGLGSGIKRALEKWRDIDFTDDREGCLFTVTIHRKMPNGSFDLTDNLKSSGKVREKFGESSGKNLKKFGKKVEKSSGKTENQVFTFLSENPGITIPEIAKTLGLTTRAVEKQIAKLRGKGRLHRIGPARGGHWQTIEKGDSCRIL